MGAGLCFEEGENQELVKYQAAHYELVASALATKIAHEIDPENKVGCMLAAGQYYPNTAHPRDYWAAMEEDRKSYFFIDVQARGEYPNYAKKQWERERIEIQMTAEDLELLKDNTVDFVSFSYYASLVASGDPEVKELNCWKLSLPLSKILILNPQNGDGRLTHLVFVSPSMLSGIVTKSQCSSWKTV